MQPWIVTLVCGASGVGKSRIATALAARYGVPLAEVDDIVTALKAVTTPAQQPVLHFWDTHPAATTWPPDKIAEQHFSLCEALRPALEAVIADHIEFRSPVVVEGDYLVPALVVPFNGAARAVVVSEPDPDQILANFLAREPANGSQHARAMASAAIDAQLVERAIACQQPVVAARPWRSGVDRTDSALHYTIE